MSASALSNKGYQPFLPTYSCERRANNRISKTDRPLFPGYFFCRFDVLKRLPILTTPGIVSVLGFGNDPAAIPDTEIEAIETIIRSGRAAHPCPFPRKGEHIRIDRGPMKGLEGVLERYKSEWRLVVSVTMLQRSVSVELDRDAISVLS